MPNTVNKALQVPNTGDLPGTWGSAAINPDMVAIDGMFGGVTTVSLSSVGVTLTVPAGAITPSAGPTQSQNAVIRFTGSVTVPIAVGVTLPGYYIFENYCTFSAGTYVLITRFDGSGEKVGLCPGKAQHVYYDGTNVRFVNMPDVGTYSTMAVSSLPVWITASTVRPWLSCDGTVYNISTYPFLGALLGATFGGNGSTTFGVPDLRGRALYMIDGGAGRLTNATMSTNGTIGGSGGLQTSTLVAGNIPLLTTTTENVPHTHTLSGQVSGGNTGAAGGDQQNQFAGTGVTSGPSTTHVHNVGNASPTAFSNMSPAFIGGMVLIKT